MIVTIKDCPDNLSGIYKINFPNGKSYIGLSNNIKRRMKEHLIKDNLPVHQAIQKYGLTEFELLEEIPANDRTLLQDREKYWINFYHTNNKTIGYNLTDGGDGASAGTSNLSAKLNDEQIQEIYSLLIENKIFIKDIAKQYDISAEAISDINRGLRYYNSDLTYPLRPDTRFVKGQNTNKKGIESHTSKFCTQEALDEIYDLIKNSSLSLAAIAKQKGVSYTTISKINRGLTYVQENESYPLRKHTVTSSRIAGKITDENLPLIIDDLKNTSLSFYNIGLKYGVSDSTIGRINNGKAHRIDGEQYPIRHK